MRKVISDIDPVILQLVDGGNSQVFRLPSGGGMYSNIGMISFPVDTVDDLFAEPALWENYNKLKAQGTLPEVSFQVFLKALGGEFSYENVGRQRGSVSSLTRFTGKNGVTIELTSEVAMKFIVEYNAMNIRKDMKPSEQPRLEKKYYAVIKGQQLIITIRGNSEKFNQKFLPATYSSDIEYNELKYDMQNTNDKKAACEFLNEMLSHIELESESTQASLNSLAAAANSKTTTSSSALALAPAPAPASSSSSSSSSASSTSNVNNVVSTEHLGDGVFRVSFTGTPAAILEAFSVFYNDIASLFATSSTSSINNTARNFTGAPGNNNNNQLSAEEAETMNRLMSRFH